MLKDSLIIEYINSDLEKLKNYYNKCSIGAKEQIREKWIFTELKKLSVKSNCKYIKSAYIMLNGEEISNVQKVLDYLNSLDIKLAPTHQQELILFKALLYELLVKYVDASLEYKKLLKLKFNKDNIQIYQEFIKRTKETKRDLSKISIDKSIKYINKYSDDIKEIEKSAKSLEAIAKYYARSQQSLDLAQDYYKQALLIYKRMMEVDLSHTRTYVLALIKAYETYNLSKEYLTQAENLIFYSKECKDAEVYLLNKIKILKER